MIGRWLLRVSLVVVTVACTWLTASRLRISGDLSTLFPERGDAAALVRWTRAFGGREPAVVLVRGTDPGEVAAVTDALAASLRGAPSIAHVLDRAPSPGDLRSSDPTLAWILAGPQARARLATILTPEGMRRRIEETRAMLLAPAVGADVEAWLARDPLRLALVPWEGRVELAAGVGAAPGDAFVADEGRARLVLAQPRGNAFVSDDARAVVEDFARARTVAVAGHPGVTVELAGGHAIAWATEQMLRADLVQSGVLSGVLASLAFVLTFRRLRALVAVLPPLAIGTVWTTGLAALLPEGVHALAIAFAAVVVGVGVDTGVHVYAAVLDARREGHGPRDAARRAREATWRPTLTAAVVAAAAFGSLALSELRAMKQLGLLCGAGELLTAVAILLVTPEIGGWLERGAPPPSTTPAWVGLLSRMLGTRRRATIALAACAAPVLIVVIQGWPAPADALVAIRPHGLAPLDVETRVQALFGGSARQWIVLDTARDEQAARAQADGLAEGLESAMHAGLADGFDALGTFDPSDETRHARLAERDALDLPSRRADLETALRQAGFDLDACAPALAAFAHPSPGTASENAEPDGALAWLRDRHVARDGDESLVATYVRPAPDPGARARLRDAIEAVDPRAAVTGLDAIDRALREALSHDLVVVGLVALGLVAVAMRLVLRSARNALVALATLATEMALVGLAMRVLSVRWHVYDALVVPVLFGVTVDESMFMLHAARAFARDQAPGQMMARALGKQGPLVAATALTTAAGFAALIPCRFDGLRDLGVVGTLGVLAGLLAALIVVPAALRVRVQEEGARGS
jgi:predicted exporter